LALTVNIALPQPRSNEVQTLIQQQLRRVGVRLSINPGDQSKQTLDALDLDTVQIKGVKRLLRLRSEEHTSELQSRFDLVFRLLRPPPSTLFAYPPLFRSCSH